MDLIQDFVFEHPQMFSIGVDLIEHVDVRLAGQNSVLPGDSSLFFEDGDFLFFGEAGLEILGALQELGECDDIVDELCVMGVEGEWLSRLELGLAGA